MKKIEKEIDELIDLIKDSDVYQKYIHILKQVEINKDIKRLVDEIKQLQKKAVKKEVLNQTKKVEELDDIINNKIKELEIIPLYADYLETSEEVNNLILNIKEQMQNYLDDINN